MCERYGQFVFSQKEIDTAKDAFGIGERVSGGKNASESQIRRNLGTNGPESKPEKRVIGIDLGRKDVQLGPDYYMRCSSFVQRRTKG